MSRQKLTDAGTQPSLGLGDANALIERYGLTYRQQRCNDALHKEGSPASHAIEALAVR
ncbi:MAG: hypothetical protein ACYCWN_06630 [Ferrimicrobium sp.]